MNNVPQSCPKCGKQNQIDSVYCYECGTRISSNALPSIEQPASKSFCPKCNTAKVDNEAAFCHQCGSPYAAINKVNNVPQDSKFKTREEYDAWKRQKAVESQGKTKRENHQIISSKMPVMESNVTMKKEDTISVTASAETKTTKKCPACAEEILVEAKKCKHCGEYIEPKNGTSNKQTGSTQGEQILPNSIVCTRCKRNMVPISKSTTYGAGGRMLGTSTLVCPLCGSPDYKLNDEDAAKAANYRAGNGCLLTIFVIAGMIYYFFFNN